jgi:hypothetical protein
MKNILIYEKGRDTERQFDSEEEAQAWFNLNDPEGVAFEYPVEDLDSHQH